MNKEEFLKEHPSLKGKIERPMISAVEKDVIEMVLTENYDWGDDCFIGVSVKDVHETQLDKQKVKGVINNFEINDERRSCGWDDCLLLLANKLQLHIK